MSLKSFDKMCENYINGAQSEKAVYDERQNIIQHKLGLEAFAIFTFAVLINAFIMDMVCEYAQTSIFPMLFILLICLFYYDFRCAANGCFVGINGVRSKKTSAVWAIVIGVLDSVTFVFSDKPLILPDGKISNRLIGLAIVALVAVYGIVMLIVLHNIEKKNTDGE